MFLFVFFSYFVEQKTTSSNSTLPDPPDFLWKVIQPVKDDSFEIQIVWLPNFKHNKPGSYFYVQYYEEGYSQYQKTEPIMEDDTVNIRGLTLGKIYKFFVTSVDGENSAQSSPKYVTFPENDGSVNFINSFLKTGIFTGYFV